jgi:hypothetical protein
MVRTRVTATAACEWCAWRIQMTADNALEVADGLRQRLIAHATDQHPEQFPTPPAAPPERLS